jgi:hypothetical protein
MPTTHTAPHIRPQQPHQQPSKTVASEQELIIQGALEAKKMKSTVSFYNGLTPSGGPAISADLIQITATVLQLGNDAIEFTPTASGVPFAPYLTVNGKTVSGDTAVVRYLARVSGSAPAARFLNGGSDALLTSQIDQWLQLYTHVIAVASTNSAANVDLPTVLNSHLATCSYLVGFHLTLADIAMFIALKKLSPEIATGKLRGYLSDIWCFSYYNKTLVDSVLVSSSYSGLRFVALLFVSRILCTSL